MTKDEKRDPGSCSSVNGCPISTALDKVKTRKTEGRRISAAARKRVLCSHPAPRPDAPALVHDHHLCRVHDCVEAVGDGNDGAVHKIVANGLLNERVRVVVHVGGGLVQDQHTVRASNGQVRTRAGDGRQGGRTAAAYRF